MAELPSRPEAAPEAEAVEVPEAYRTVRSLLLSRDGFIKPGRNTLDAHPEATEALEWLAGHDEMLLVRERALLTLDQYPDEATAQVCVDFLSAEHAKVRAAAVRCLQEHVRTGPDGSFSFSGLDPEARLGLTALSDSRMAASVAGVLPEGPVELVCPLLEGEQPTQGMLVSGEVSGAEPGAYVYVLGRTDSFLAVADEHGTLHYSLSERVPEQADTFAFSTLVLDPVTYAISSGGSHEVEVDNIVHQDVLTGELGASTTLLSVRKPVLDGELLEALDASSQQAGLVTVYGEDGEILGWVSGWRDEGGGFTLSVRALDAPGAMAGLSLTADLNRPSAWSQGWAELSLGDQEVAVLDAPALAAHGDYPVGATLEWQPVEGADHYQLQLCDHGEVVWSLRTERTRLTLPVLPEELDPGGRFGSSPTWALCAVGPDPSQLACTAGHEVEW